jgi:hypothetical protein
MVWFASYLGWVPAVGILAPADLHPLQRSLLMIAALIVRDGANCLEPKPCILKTLLPAKAVS